MTQTIIEHKFYTFYSEKIKVIYLPTFTTFTHLISYDKKRVKGKQSNCFYTFFILWISSYIKRKNIFDRYLIKKSISKMIGDFYIEDTIFNKCIDTAIKNNKIHKDNLKYYFTTYTHYIWKKEELNKHFNNDYDLIKKYKKQLIFNQNKIDYEIEKQNLIKEEIELYISNGYYKCQIIDLLLQKTYCGKKKYDINFIYKMINSYNIEERSKRYLLIDEALKRIFNFKLTKQLNIDILIEVLKDFNIEISKSAFYNYLTKSPIMKNKINELNKTLPKDVIVKEEIVIEELLEKPFGFLDAEDLLESQIIPREISWEESERLDNKEKEEWTDEDDMDFKMNKNIVKVFTTVIEEWDEQDDLDLLNKKIAI